MHFYERFFFLFVRNILFAVFSDYIGTFFKIAEYILVLKYFFLKVSTYRNQRELQVSFLVRNWYYVTKNVINNLWVFWKVSINYIISILRFLKDFMQTLHPNLLNAKNYYLKIGKIEMSEVAYCFIRYSTK